MRLSRLNSWGIQIPCVAVSWSLALCREFSLLFPSLIFACLGVISLSIYFLDRGLDFYFSFSCSDRHSFSYKNRIPLLLSSLSLSFPLIFLTLKENISISFWFFGAFLFSLCGIYIFLSFWRRCLAPFWKQFFGAFLFTSGVFLPVFVADSIFYTESENLLLFSGIFLLFFFNMRVISFFEKGCFSPLFSASLFSMFLFSLLFSLLGELFLWQFLSTSFLFLFLLSFLIKKKIRDVESFSFYVDAVLWFPLLFLFFDR